jgi:hypothetical protein
MKLNIRGFPAKSAGISLNGLGDYAGRIDHAERSASRARD